MLILARHGRTAANAGGLLQGRRDLPLDELGVSQAAALGAVLAAEPGGVERIVSSPLQRARQTAQAIAEATGAPVEVDEAWIELDYGELDGTPLTEVPPEVWRRWRVDPSFAPEGGESLLDVAARVEPAASSLLSDGAEPAGAIVVVSHVSPIKAAVTWALGGGAEQTWRLFLAPASLCRIGRGPSGPVVHGFNDVAHLPPA